VELLDNEFQYSMDNTTITYSPNVFAVLYHFFDGIVSSGEGEYFGGGGYSFGITCLDRIIIK